MSVNMCLCAARRGLPDGHRSVKANFHKWSGQDHVEVETPQLQKCLQVYAVVVIIQPMAPVKQPGRR